MIKIWVKEKDLKIRRESDNSKIEILKFWSINKEEYLNLSEIAITYLCIPCGNCDAERSFSKMIDFNTIKTNSIKLETLRMQLLLYNFI